MTFKDLKVGERGTFRMLLLSIQQKDGRGGAYCVLSLKPSRNENPVSAKIWNREKNVLIQVIPEKSVVTAVISCSEYNGAKSYVVDSITAEKNADISEFLDRSEIEANVFYGCMMKHADKDDFRGHPANMIFRKLYEDNHDKLLYWPAAVGVHHNYIGGLIAHMSTVAINSLMFARAAAPALVRKVDGKTSDEIIEKGIVGLSFKDKFLTDFQRAVLDMYSKKGFVDAPDAAKRKYFTRLIADSLTRTYRYVNREVLMTAVLYRDIHNLTADPMASVIGGSPSDVICFRNDMKALGVEPCEKTDMIEHCLLVDLGNNVKPVTAEAFLLVYAEKLAEIAIRNSGNNDYDVCAAFSAAAVHDIGKLIEYSADATGTAEFAREGHLYGHAMIGIEMVLDCAKELNIPVSDITKFLNCIASHHEKKEWGAVTAPVFEESEVVAVLDYIDSRMDVYHRRCEASEPGEFDDTSLRTAGVLVYRPAL